jgi:hypothetical protein
MIQKFTEQSSRYDHLEKMSVRELLENIKGKITRYLPLLPRVFPI